MSKYKLEILNPTTRMDSEILKVLFNKHRSLSHYQPVTLTVKGRGDVELICTHPYFTFYKPARYSKKGTGIFKNYSEYVGFFEPECYGSGASGGVSPLVAVVRLAAKELTFKTPSKKRLVKSTFFLNRDDESSKELYPLYLNEYTLGRYVPHMGYSYSPVQLNSQSYQLMYELPGVSLETITNKLKSYPDSMSFTEKLRIIIGLLEQLDIQISNVVVPGTAGYRTSKLIHRDIKPDNILVDDKSNIKFIDFGLALRASCQYPSRGAELYCDPLFLDTQGSDPKSAPSELDITAIDYASVSRVIADFLGDKLYCNTSSENLVALNRLNALNGVLDNDKGISESEKTTVINTLRLMTARTNRIPKHKALEIFRALLATRIAQEEAFAKELVAAFEIAKVAQRPKYELFTFLSSRFYQLFIDKLSLVPEVLPQVYDLLSYRLLELPKEVLHSLKKIGMDFSHCTLLNKGFENHSLTAQRIQLLLDLGVPLNDDFILYWVESVVALNRLNWAEVCRLLYQRNSELVLKAKPQSTFKSLFINHVLLNSNSSKDDKSNVRLISRHISITTKINDQIQWIKECLTREFDQSPLQKGIIETLDSLKFEPLCLYVNADDLNNLINQLLSLVHCKESIELRVDEPEFVNRGLMMARLQRKMDKLIQVEKGSWQVSMTYIDIVDSLNRRILDLDELKSILMGSIPDRIKQSVLKEFDGYYGNIPFEVAEECVFALVKAFKILAKIEALDCRAQLQSDSLEQKLQTIEESGLLFNAKAYLQNVRQLKNLAIESQKAKPVVVDVQYNPQRLFKEQAEGLSGVDSSEEELSFN